MLRLRLKIYSVVSYLLVFFATLGLVFIYMTVKSDISYAATSTVYMYPDSDSFGTPGRWVVGGTGCAQLYCRINQYPGVDTTYIQHEISQNSAYVQYFTLTDPEYIGQGVTNFNLQFYAASANFADGADTVHDDMMSRAKYGMTTIDNGTDIFSPAGNFRVNNFTTGGFTYQLFQQNQSTVLSKSQLNDTRVGFDRIRQGSIFASQLHRIRAARVEVTYTKAPLWDQTNYRFYQSSSTTTPGTALASAQNTAARLPNEGDAFRLRMGLSAGETAWGASFGNYKLQYALKSSSCSASSFSDVQSGSGDIRWYNAGPGDGAGISSYASDPSGTKTYQAYRISNSFTNGAAVPVGNLALWDFSLRDHSGQPGNTYCFRIVKEDQVNGYESITYTRYPEIQTVGILGVGFVNTAQASINPIISFDTKYMLFQCQTSTSQAVSGGSFVRITNNISENGWTASIAPTNGPSATWHDVVSGNRMDFNDGAGSPAGCFAGSDGDTYPGQLTVNASALSITRQKAGCNTVGLSHGNTAGFQEGTLNSVTLYSASSSSNLYCWWDIADLSFSQRIPPLTPPGDYEIDMTLTVTAS